MQIEFASPSQFPASVPSSLSSEEEYTIYAYSFFENERLGCNRWTRMTSSSSSAHALQYAEGLYKSQQYQKIEIKKKAYNDKKGRYMSSTFRVYGNKFNKKYIIPTATALIITLIVAGLFHVYL